MWWFSSFSYCNINIILIILVLSQIINVLSENPIIVKSEPFNYYDNSVSVIFKAKDSLIKNKFGDGFKDSNFKLTYMGKYSVEKYNIKNESVLLPADGTLFQNNHFLEFFYDQNWRSQFATTSGIYCSLQQHYKLTTLIDSENKNNLCLNVMEYYVEMHYVEKKTILSINWTPQHTQNYLKIVYMFKTNYYFDIILEIYDEDQNEIYSSHFMNEINWTVLTIESQSFMANKKFKIVFSKIGNSISSDSMKLYNKIKFGIYQIINTIPSNNTKDPTNNTHTNNSLKKCLNGGYKIHNESSCICPPGFKGIFCEEGCGPNSYGTDCSKRCSMFKKGCRGTYFCPNNYPCTCPAGLTGPFCDEDCSPLNYGAGCNQLCPVNCFNYTCNQYTGVCSQGCLQGYVPPYCNEKYTAYLRNPPKFISATPGTLTIEINFELENIKDIYEHINIKYYQLLWMASDEHTYTRSEVKLFSFQNTEETISGLKSYTTYSVGVLLIMEDGNYDNESMVFGQYKTTCFNSDFDESNIQVTEGFKSINVTWNNIESLSEFHCSITEFLISLRIMDDNEQNNITDSLVNIVPSSMKSYAVYDVIPGNEYNVSVIPKTVMGDLPSLTYFVTSKLTNEDLVIKDVTAKFTNENKVINLSWKCVNNFDLNNDIDDVPVTYIVKYKIHRILSCSLEDIENDWTLITVHNSTNYDILDVIPNSQYMFQVIITSKDDNTTVHHENIIYALTPASLPTIEPVIVTKFITNNSIMIYWKTNQTQCSKMNGLFVNYVIELKNNNDNITTIKETKQNYLYFNELESNTHYELKVFMKNHVGYNFEHFLLINFKTNYDIAPVDDFMIYKKSFKNQMLGLRWSYSDVENVDGFIISFHDDTSNDVINETVISPTSCLAWPDFYCYTINNLNYNHTIKVRAKSLEYPKGGKTSSVRCNKIDGIPDSPNNLKAIEIGKTNLTLQWDIPWIFNGELKSFILNIEEISSVDIQTCCEIITPVEIPFVDERPSYTYTITNLRPGSTYSIGVMSKSFWYSSPSRIQVTTLV